MMRSGALENLSKRAAELDKRIELLTGRVAELNDQVELLTKQLAEAKLKRLPPMTLSHKPALIRKGIPVGDLLNGHVRGKAG